MYVFFIIFFLRFTYIVHIYLHVYLLESVLLLSISLFTLIYCSFRTLSLLLFFFFFLIIFLLFLSLFLSLFLFLFLFLCISCVLPIKRSLHYPRSNKSQYLQLMRPRENSNSSQRTDIAFSNVSPRDCFSILNQRSIENICMHLIVATITLYKLLKRLPLRTIIRFI